METSILRGFVTFLGGYLICQQRGDQMDYRKGFWTLTLRNSLMVINSITIATLQFYVPLPIIHTVGALGPVFVVILEYFLESKKITAKQGLGIGISFIGTFFVSNAHLLTSWIHPGTEFESEFKNYHSEGTWVILICCLIYLFNMAGWAYGIWLTKKVPSNSFEINVHFGALLILFNSCIYQGYSEHTKGEVFYWGILWIGVLLLGAETAFVAGIKMSVNTGMCVMLGLFVIPVSYFFSVVFYS